MRNFLGIAAAVVLLGAVVWCALAPSPDLVHIGWMPRWLGGWADANPTFRNFPAFGALAVGFFLAAAACFRFWRAGKLAGLAAIAASFVAVVLEVVQVFLPGRFFDPADIAWSVAGAIVGAAIIGFVSKMLARLFGER